MQIKIDTVNKTIEVISQVNIVEFYEFLKNFKDWESYKVVSSYQTIHINPVYPQTNPWWVEPYQGPFSLGGTNQIQTKFSYTN